MNNIDMREIAALSDTLIHALVAKYCPGSAREKAAKASSFVDLKNRTRAKLALSPLINHMHNELDAHESRPIAPPRIVRLSPKTN